MTASMREQLIDRLQVAAPLVQRIAVTAQQTHADARAAVDALAEAVELLQRVQGPTFDHPSARTIADLGLAATRQGLTVEELAFVSGVPVARLRHLLAGAVVTDEERTQLLRVLPDWRP